MAKKKRIKFFDITKVSEIASIPVSTLRRWDIEGRIVAYRDSYGRRRYDSRLVQAVFNERYGGHAKKKSFYFKKSKKRIRRNG